MSTEAMSTIETTHDAVERAKLLRSALCAAASDADELRATLLAERARHAEEVAALRAQLRRLEGLADAASHLRHALDDAHIELAARRALDADVWACAEYVVANSAPAAALSKEHQVFRETARRVLAALGKGTK